MSRRPARVTQADIARALRAAEQTGARVTVEITADGTIRLVPLSEPVQIFAPSLPETNPEPEEDIVL